MRLMLFGGSKVIEVLAISVLLDARNVYMPRAQISFVVMAFCKSI